MHLRSPFFRYRRAGQLSLVALPSALGIERTLRARDVPRDGAFRTLTRDLIGQRPLKLSINGITPFKSAMLLRILEGLTEKKSYLLEGKTLTIGVHGLQRPVRSPGKRKYFFFLLRARVVKIVSNRFSWRFPASRPLFKRALKY